MSDDEIREARIAEAVQDLADAYLQVGEHVVALGAYRQARGSDVGAGAGPGAGSDVDARKRAEDLVSDLVLLQRVVYRVAEHPDVLAKFPPSTVENAENTIRSSLEVASIVPGLTVPTYEEVRAAAANEDGS
ncbi:hypothetical protein [Nocardioides panzhihuensis]|uniref:Uncharacterized protein n=1 Tax=Nocardioides panzhihuensis TaxID=860243 RepID=A0A7Z0DSN4_9ACTN|nr:hypothetical protein [Nocardioides panzhihuensis]NYI81040.1 hypothetical protein [Nocardioides panzhihuensis]